MTVKLNPYLLLAISVGLFLLIFGTIRSCNNTKNAISKSDNLEERNAALLKDSAEWADQATQYETQSEVQDGLIAIKDNQLQEKGDSLDAANARISALLMKHKPIKASEDTSITTVPNEYINDCEGCFSELSREHKIALDYKMASESVRREYMRRKTSDSIRISKLSFKNADLFGNLKSALSSIDSANERSKPSGKVLFSVSTLLINANIPNAIGGGLAYQDRYNRIYSIKYFASKYGSIKQADIFIPISFKRKR
jgi:hypothetical protein